MTSDAMTRDPMCVSTDGTTGPSVMVAVSQLDDVRQLLNETHIRYWVEEDVTSLDGSPEIAVVNLGRGADVAAFQAALARTHKS